MNKQTAHKRGPALLATAAAAVVALACALLSPATALAAETYVAHTVDASGSTYYYSRIADAVSAGYEGNVVYMDADWDFGSDSLNIADSKSITIQMAGHKIVSNNKDATIYVNEHANVKITSSEPAKDFSYRGFAKKNEGDIQDKEWDWTGLTVKTSGLINNAGQGLGRGIHLEKGAKLTLENVAVAGCGNSGIYMKDSTTANLTNVSVCHNRAANGEFSPYEGAGVCMADGCELNLNASHVDSNFSYGNAGGVYAGSGAHIYLENGSTISGNAASYGGGGVYFNKSFFTLKSADGTGVIASNACYSTEDSQKNSKTDGGAIHVDASSGNNEGLIEGLTIKDNYARGSAGAIALYQRWTTVRKCVITGNTARRYGGAVGILGQNNAIDSCTITGNTCDLRGDGNTGGGINVPCDYDIKLSGTCIIKDNTRNQENRDDVFLAPMGLNVGHAYITGKLEQGSSVGVRTEDEGDVRVAKNFSCPTKDGLFSDMFDYYISYGTDEGGDAWQRYANKEFTATINGKNPVKCRQRMTATLVAPATQGDDLVFWHWDAEKTTGLYPVSDYITDEGAYNNTLSFSMPQNDVNAVAVYATRAKKVAVTVKSPVAGEALPATAELNRLEGEGYRGPFSASVTWYEVGENGSRTRATGVAKAGTSYAAEIVHNGDDKYGLYFSASVSAQDVTLKADGAALTPAVESAAVDAKTGRLTVKTGAFEKTAGQAAEAKTGTVKVKVEKKALLSNGEKAQAAEAAVLSDEVSADEFEVSYAYSDDTDEVTIAAPALTGYNFCNWKGVESGWVSNDAEGVVVIPASSLADIQVLTAVYTPVASIVEVGLAAPVAGQALAGTANDVKLTCYDGTFESFAEAMGREKDGFKVTWSPAPEDGVAAYGTYYTALIELCDASGVTDLEDVLAEDAIVTCDTEEVPAAGFVVVDGKLCLAVSFDATADKATEPDDSGKTDGGEQPGDATDDATDDSAKDEDANANEGQVNDQAATTVTTTATTAKAAKAGTPSTGDVTFTAAGALLAVSATCLAVAVFSRRSQH